MAWAAIGAHVIPCRERDGYDDTRNKILPAKMPYTRNGLSDASTDTAVIRRWWSRWPDALVGIVAGPSGLVAADVDMGEGKDGWYSIDEAGLELPATFSYKTRSGGDHYVYLDPKTVALGPTQGHVTPNGVVLHDVDRRGGNSYFITWGDEVPADRTAFAAPPAWLLTPAEATGTPFDGTVVEWFAKCAPGEPDFMFEQAVSSIPTEDFGHPKMIALQRAMVGLATEGWSGAVWALNRLREEWLRHPYDTQENRDDFDRGLRDAIKKYGRFPPAPADILSVDTLPLMAKLSPEELEAVTTLPADAENPAALRQRGARVATIALGAGLSTHEAAVLVLRCAASAALRQHADGGVGEAWAIVRDAIQSPVLEDSPVVMPEGAPAPEQVDESGRKQPALLTVLERARLEDERKELAAEQRFLWWGDEFMWVQAQLNSPITEQYYRLNRWIILSVMLSPYAVIVTKNGTILPLNFYGMILGPSGTGKSEAIAPIKTLVRLNVTDSPDIGGNATYSGLVEKLIERDHKASWFHADEADRALKDWSNDKGEFRGMKQGITDLYGGDVPAIQRATKKEISGIHARAYLSVLLTGVFDRVTDAIEPGDWEDGYINRFIFAIGERKPRTRESKRPGLMRKGAGPARSSEQTPVAKWAQEWWSRFEQVRKAIEPEDPKDPMWVGATDEVLDRHVDTIESLEAIARASAHPERLDPTFTRLEKTILKCAALAALMDLSPDIEMKHYLIALEQAEEWLANALLLVAATDESPRVRRVNRLVEIIRRAGGFMAMTDVYQLDGFDDYRDVDSLIEQLKKQGRAVRENAGTPAEVIRLTKGRA
nr:bifunctional DNA primase/polymerase [Agromyces larvae]